MNSSYLKDLFNRIKIAFKKRESKGILLQEPTFGIEEIFEALKVMISTNTTMGKKVSKFEEDFARYIGIKEAVMVNSGSSANLLAFSVLTNPKVGKLEPGDEVIVPAVCWSTTIFPIIQHGLVPVIVDVELDTMNIDVNKIYQAVTDKTRAIIIVHTYGNPCNMDEILKVVKKHNLVLIEDCCEALGAKYKDIPVGSFGLIGTYSFYFSHHITTFEGGMCVTDDFEIAELIRILRSHGWIRHLKDKSKYIKKYSDFDSRFLFVNLGYNLRPTEIQAAVGILQLKKLDRFVKIRRENAKYWIERLKKFEEYFIVQKEIDGGYSSWFGFPIIVKNNPYFTRADICSFLEKHKIETRPIIAGNIAKQPFISMFKHKVIGNLENATTIMQNGFAVGNHQGIDKNKREYFLMTIEKFLKSKI
ncbi:MAG: aminotransferase class I/II-fold pyridoxal phosphate-dependent enzyme [bacterium]|nr:aminotransferase class I/II-fold pyridoxal phosphate-dependent enzyme [bacterium]